MILFLIINNGEMPFKVYSKFLLQLNTIANLNQEGINKAIHTASTQEGITKDQLFVLKVVKQLLIVDVRKRQTADEVLKKFYLEPSCQSDCGIEDPLFYSFYWESFENDSEICKHPIQRVDKHGREKRRRK